MKLRELLKGCKVIDIIGDEEVDVKGIAYDSRKLVENSVFICVQGFKVDGHNYIDRALENGAKVLIVEKKIEAISGVTIVRVENSRIALAYVSANFYNNPTKDMNLIGITGTNGKTTVAHLVKNILDVNGVATGLIGTIAHKILNKEYKASNTTPESTELQYMFNEMLHAGVNSAVMEVSSHSLDLHRVDSILYDIGVFTNLTKEHLDFHKTMENYKNAKSKLFYQTSLANVINVDDQYGYEIAKDIKELEAKLITYGIKNEADIYARDIKISTKGVRFKLVTPKFSGEIEIATPGMFSVYNALAAATVCYVLGYSFEQIKKGLESIKGVSGRFEVVKNTGEYTVIVDYSHTPDALENALNTIKEFSKAKIITVFGCGGDRDKTKRPIMGEIAGKLSDYCIITSDNPRSEDPSQIIRDIEVGMKKTDCEYKSIENRREAIRKAIAVATSKDIVLIAGKGHETYQILGDKTIDFDDRLVAMEIVGEEVLS
ncbi:UDP-N-acetylmuramoyl-L-alanyl-D-glutamate--2,6-diaminopimelate ligase [Lutibacter sp. B2]|nr:UDP-N-acetylmuramoyl-L-alanyl-D-glutamate--2,6-diaminopimelate ligase [Lutibacter sp. B2]